ncbi:MAG: pantetheine-phosphate adenylyltransferase [Sarcina sp.]
MREAIYPGSFDPVTIGHLDVIIRASKIFEKVIVAVLINVDKKGLFTIDERVKMLKEVTKEYDNIEVISFSGLLVELVKIKNNPVILKGLRNSTDFEYEMQMDLLNKMLDENVETMYIVSNPMYAQISSSAVKQIAKFNGAIDKMVPDFVKKKIVDKMGMV